MSHRPQSPASNPKGRGALQRAVAGATGQQRPAAPLESFSLPPISTKHSPHDEADTLAIGISACVHCFQNGKASASALKRTFDDGVKQLATRSDSLPRLLAGVIRSVYLFPSDSVLQKWLSSQYTSAKPLPIPLLYSPQLPPPPDQVVSRVRDYGRTLADRIPRSILNTPTTPPLSQELRLAAIWAAVRLFPMRCYTLIGVEPCETAPILTFDLQAQALSDALSVAVLERLMQKGWASPPRLEKLYELVTSFNFRTSTDDLPIPPSFVNNVVESLQLLYSLTAQQAVTPEGTRASAGELIEKAITYSLAERCGGGLTGEIPAGGAAAVLVLPVRRLAGGSLSIALSQGAASVCAAVTRSLVPTAPQLTIPRHLALEAHTFPTNRGVWLTVNPEGDIYEQELDRYLGSYPIASHRSLSGTMRRGATELWGQVFRECPTVKTLYSAPERRGGLLLFWEPDGYRIAVPPEEQKLASEMTGYAHFSPVDPSELLSRFGIAPPFGWAISSKLSLRQPRSQPSALSTAHRNTPPPRTGELDARGLVE